MNFFYKILTVLPWIVFVESFPSCHYVIGAVEEAKNIVLTKFSEGRL